MPNGGSDCCGTCWFNSNNEGRPGYHGGDRGGEVRCTIRDLVIAEPFWTYCVNHPHHNPHRVSLPIGPVYVDAGGFPYGRRIWTHSPDSEALRVQLLRLLWTVAERPASEYPAGRTLDEAVVEQLGRFREVRAVEGLRRILSFRPDARSFGPFERDQRRTLGFALESLAMILGDGAIADLQDYVGYGLPAPNPEQDFCAPLRYFAVRAWPIALGISPGLCWSGSRPTPTGRRRRSPTPAWGLRPARARRWNECRRQQAPA